uniref:G-protein coupled receptors family 1 profile domain-containing protein n=1 Tax=Dendroctonus ponderosae TaxID=77166 RepID=A0AAR5PYW0_DENPD
MMSCYSHILLVVKKQQNRWNNLSRIGSKRIKGKPSEKLTKERKQLEGNVRAIYTTLLIVGSCVIGWTPALLIYTMTCTVGCYISGENIITLNCEYPYPILALRLIDNILIILKMLANPIIYSIRMREIKDGTYRMYLAALGICCESRRNALECSGFYYRSRMQNSIGGGTVQVRVTSVKNGKSNLIATGEESSFL